MSLRPTTAIEREAARISDRVLWLHGATDQRFGLCNFCNRVRDDQEKPLLVARQGRRRLWECFDCWKAKQ